MLRVYTQGLTGDLIPNGLRASRQGGIKAFLSLITGINAEQNLLFQKTGKFYLVTVASRLDLNGVGSRRVFFKTVPFLRPLQGVL